MAPPLSNETELPRRQGLATDAIEPGLDPPRRSAQKLAASSRRIDLLNIGDRPLDGEIEIRQQVDLVEDDERCGAKHMRVLKRLVLALGVEKMRTLARSPRSNSADTRDCRRFR